jgi:hypothetical protein
MKPQLFIYGLGLAVGAYTLYMLLSGRNTWPTDRVAVNDWYWPWHK